LRAPFGDSTFANTLLRKLNIVTADVVGEDISPHLLQGTGPVVFVLVAHLKEAASFEEVPYAFCDHFVGANLKEYNCVLFP
jgi:hypothetical protein